MRSDKLKELRQELFNLEYALKLASMGEKENEVLRLKEEKANVKKEMARLMIEEKQNEGVVKK